MKKRLIIILSSLFCCGIVLFLIHQSNKIKAEISIVPSGKDGVVKFKLIGHEDNLYNYSGSLDPIFYEVETQIDGEWVKETHFVSKKSTYSSPLVRGQGKIIELDNYGNQERWRIKIPVYRDELKFKWYQKIAAYFKIETEVTRELISPEVSVYSLVH